MAAEHYNMLTPAESERLALLLEEMGEAQQAIGKILRHGYESFNPNDITQSTNRLNLMKELADVAVSIDYMIEARDVDESIIKNYYQEKHDNVKQYLHHN